MMMGHMMNGGMLCVSTLATVLLLGFAYIIWVLANKEGGKVKIIGQILAALIAVLALGMLLYHGIYGWGTGKSWGGGSGTGHSMMMGEMHKQMMNMSAEEKQKMMKEMIEDEDLHNKMHEQK